MHQKLKSPSFNISNILIYFQEQDIIKEVAEKQKILKDKDGLLKELERLRGQLQEAEVEKKAEEKEALKLYETTKV